MVASFNNHIIIQMMRNWILGSLWVLSERSPGHVEGAIFAGTHAGGATLFADEGIDGVVAAGEGATGPSALPAQSGRVSRPFPAGVNAGR
jgi:hypothetical protein